MSFQSPYSVFREFRKSDSELKVQSKFREQLSSHVEPLLAEVVSEETRRLQKLLLFAGSLLVLISLSIVDLPDEFDWNGIKLKVLANSTFALIVVATTYLETIVSIRSQLDWRAWNIRSASARLRLEHAVLYAFINRGSGADEYIDEVHRHVEESFNRHADPPLSGDEKRQRDELREEAIELRDMAKTQAAWIDAELAPLIKANRRRVAIELLFPILYGASALLIAGVTRIF